MSTDGFNTLCGPCNRILDTISEAAWYTNLIHHQSLATLYESSRHGCGICTVTLEHLHSSEFEQVPDLWDNLFPLKCKSDTSSASWQESFDLTIISDDVETLHLKFTFDSIWEVTDGNENVYVPSNSTDSPQSWELMNSWLERCRTYHKRCNAEIPRSLGSTWAPTRLVDIGRPGDECLRLVEPRNESSFNQQPYATLSHCWGKSRLLPMVITTRANFRERCKRIDPSEMPKTFLDAIRIAQAFHVRYLWIDCLCIVQDDMEDWACEAGLMSKVYRYCYIGIAATGANEGSVGCFFERNPQSVRPTEFGVQWKNYEDNQITRYRVVPHHDFWAQKLVSEPLNQRCWVLQERILCPRNLQFGHEQLFWECREMVACETYPHGLPVSLQKNRLIGIKTLDLGDEPQDNRWPVKYASQTLKPAGTMVGSIWGTITNLFRPTVTHELTLNAPMNNASAYRDWDSIVELYSLGHLTYARDKLIALLGLAEAISSRQGNTLHDGYLAGLWQSSLPSHLLWTTRQDQKSTQTPSRYLSRDVAPTYVAPSWSWASIDGRISFSWCQHNYDLNDYLATLESAEMNWEKQGVMFGSAESGFLRLTGPLASILWRKQVIPPLARARSAQITHLYPRHFDCRWATEVAPDAMTAAEVLFDTASDEVHEELILLPIIGTSKRTAHEQEAVLGLVLRQESGVDTYSRVGVFDTTRFRVGKILKNMPRQTVTVI